MSPEQGKILSSINSPADLKNYSEKGLYPIYDPHFLIGEKNLKGGNMINEN